MTDSQQLSFPRAGFRRRFGSYIYDVLLALAVYMVAGFFSFLILSLLVHFNLVSMNGHQHVSDLQQNSVIITTLIYTWNFAWVAFFFVWFWTRGGQTLGMRAWRLKVQNVDGSSLTTKTAILRLLPTLLGLGNLTVLFDRKNKLSLQDRVTKTEVVVLSLAANKGKNWHN